MRYQLITLKEQAWIVEATTASLGEKTLVFKQGESVVAEFARESIAGWRLAPGEELKK